MPAITCVEHFRHDTHRFGMLEFNSLLKPDRGLCMILIHSLARVICPSHAVDGIFVALLG